MYQGSFEAVLIVLEVLVFYIVADFTPSTTVLLVLWSEKYLFSFMHCNRCGIELGHTTCPLLLITVGGTSDLAGNSFQVMRKLQAFRYVTVM